MPGFVNCWFGFTNCWFGFTNCWFGFMNCGFGFTNCGFGFTNCGFGFMGPLWPGPYPPNCPPGPRRWFGLSRSSTPPRLRHPASLSRSLSHEDDLEEDDRSWRRVSELRLRLRLPLFLSLSDSYSRSSRTFGATHAYFVTCSRWTYFSPWLYPFLLLRTLCSLRLTVSSARMVFWLNGFPPAAYFNHPGMLRGTRRSLDLVVELVLSVEAREATESTEVAVLDPHEPRDLYELRELSELRELLKLLDRGIVLINRRVYDK